MIIIRNMGALTLPHSHSIQPGKCLNVLRDFEIQFFSKRLVLFEYLRRGKTFLLDLFDFVFKTKLFIIRFHLFKGQSQNQRQLNVIYSRSNAGLIYQKTFCGWPPSLCHAIDLFVWWKFNAKEVNNNNNINIITNNSN